MLEDLFYGNLCPCDMDSRQNSCIRPLMQRLTDAEGDLRATLNDAGRKKVDTFSNANMDLNRLMMKLSFEDGFRIATGLALDLYCARQREAGQCDKKVCR